MFAIMDVELRYFVEEMGLAFEEMGSTRMAGRIYGMLLVCDPAECSSARLAQALDASPASISTASRQLLHMGLITKVAAPGRRGLHFAILPDTLERTMLQDIARMRIMRELCGRGLEKLAGQPRSVRARLQDLHDLYRFMEVEIPTLVERWRATRATPEST